jgi:uncharacterized protein (TIGR00661 family)
MKKKILVAPLNWGLGHATRCIPIINTLLKLNYTPIIASDGVALVLLKKEFPRLTFDELPSYNVTYSKKASLFKWKLLLDSPKLLHTINEEKRTTNALLKKHNIDGIISDNRLGVSSKKVPSVFITHQLNVLSGSTTWLSTKIHQNIIKKFDVCWVPDNEFTPNLSGKLGHITNTSLPIKYLGPLSRFEKTDATSTYDLMILLSGPEPQRTLLEKKLLLELQHFKGKTLFVRGVIEAEEIITVKNNITIYNFMQSNALEHAINSSNIILSRSGYTTVMDLAKIGKKAFFIPTPGQFEQEYLATLLDELKLVPTCSQDDFKIELLNKIKDYKGLTIKHESPDFEVLFGLFEGE